MGSKVLAASTPEGMSSIGVVVNVDIQEVVAEQFQELL
jgi:hypothetical protein